MKCPGCGLSVLHHDEGCPHSEVHTAGDGGQAFPCAYTVGPNDDLYPPNPGMSLRDWFAGQALVAYLSRPDSDESDYAETASYAYCAADAMIAERSK